MDNSAKVRIICEEWKEGSGLQNYYEDCEDYADYAEISMPGLPGGKTLCRIVSLFICCQLYIIFGRILK